MIYTGNVPSSRSSMHRLTWLFAILAVWAVCCGGNSEQALELYTQGKKAYAERKLDAAAQLFTQAIAADGDFVPGRIMLGKTHFYAGEFEKAEAVLKDLAADHPGNATAHFWLGRLYLTMEGRVADAQRHLQQTVQLDENHFNAHFYLAKTYEQQNKVKEALIEYNRATVIKRDFDKIHRALADLYRRSGFPERAVRELGRMEGAAVTAEAGEEGGEQ